MPDVMWNRQTWDGSYDWTQAGEEWSETWGGSDMQWFGAILPRIHAFLPAESILEIAPGYGRWTQYLQAQCHRLHVVDLSVQCIEACKGRFAQLRHITYSTTDGKSLAMVPDNSIDFCFSFDSLVHCEADVIEAYVSQLARKLTVNGVAFIHHSNFGNHLPPFRRVFSQRAYPALSRVGLLERFRELGFVPYEHHRGRSMTAEKMRAMAEAHGVRCLSQETINWGTSQPIDCLSTIVRQDSAWPRHSVFRENRQFMREAAELRCLSELYGYQRLVNRA